MTHPIQRLSPYAIDGLYNAGDQMEDDPSGDYVRWEDYTALAARLQMVLDREAATCTRSDTRQRALEAQLKDYRHENYTMAGLLEREKALAKAAHAAAEAMEKEARAAINMRGATQ